MINLNEKEQIMKEVRKKKIEILGNFLIRVDELDEILFNRCEV